jgi:hypothetical protein
MQDGNWRISISCSVLGGRHEDAADEGPGCVVDFACDHGSASQRQVADNAVCVSQFDVRAMA